MFPSASCAGVKACLIRPACDPGGAVPGVKHPSRISGRYRPALWVVNPIFSAAAGRTRALPEDRSHPGRSGPRRSSRQATGRDRDCGTQRGLRLQVNPPVSTDRLWSVRRRSGDACAARRQARRCSDAPVPQAGRGRPESGCRHPAVDEVDEDSLAGEEADFGWGDEEDGVGDLLGAVGPADGGRGQEGYDRTPDMMGPAKRPAAS